MFDGKNTVVFGAKGLFDSNDLGVKSSERKTFYVTTAIDYLNAEPHIGHAYQKIAADVLARWHRLLGEDVYFLTGTDEHGKKVANSALAVKKSPKEYVDEVSIKFKQAWEALEIEPNRFIRTTDPDHKKVVLEFIERAKKSGDIYKGTYSGLYCVGCEAYYTEKDAINGECPFHPGKKLERMEEETYFFRLSKYQKFLLDLYDKRPEFILPHEVRKDIIKRVSEGLKDFSISRTNFEWGIPFPGDEKHVVYVWLDALINYYSPILDPTNKKYWPADYHLLGRDNTWFHTVYWPAMLASVGLELPKTVFTHGFFTCNGQKISKSLGNSISPTVLVEKYGADTIRYYILRAVPFGEDGDFSESALVDRHNTELANKLGNLVSRVSALAEKYGLEEGDLKALDGRALAEKVKMNLEKLEFNKALNEIFSFVDAVNEYIQSKMPWETKDRKVLWVASNALKDIAILLSSFTPNACKKISKVFNFSLELSEVNKPLRVSKIKKADVLFKKIELKNSAPIGGIKVGAVEKNLGNERETETVGEREFSSEERDGADLFEGGDLKLKQNSKENFFSEKESRVPYSDFAKLDFRVGKIIDVADHPKADKLYLLNVDLGEERPRIIVAGLKKFYSKEELKGKKAIFVVNLEKINLRGVESDGMILAAVEGNDDKVVFITPQKEVKEGSKVE